MYFNLSEGALKAMRELLNSQKERYSREDAEKILGGYFDEVREKLRELKAIFPYEGGSFDLTQDGHTVRGLLQHIEDDLAEIEMGKKVQQAQIDAAEAARSAAHSAKVSKICTVISVLLSIASIIISLLRNYCSC